MGKALVDGELLDCHFTRPFYKVRFSPLYTPYPLLSPPQHMLGAPVNFADLQEVDEKFHKVLLLTVQ